MINSYKVSKKIPFSCKFWNSLVLSVALFLFLCSSDTYKMKTFRYSEDFHCVKSVQIWSFFLSVFSCIQSKYRKIRTRKTLYSDTFHAVFMRVSSMFIYKLWYQYLCTDKKIASAWLFGEIYQAENYTDEDTESFSSLLVWTTTKINICWKNSACVLNQRVHYFFLVLAHQNILIFLVYLVSKLKFSVFAFYNLITLYQILNIFLLNILNCGCFIITFHKYYVICGLRFRLKNIDCLALCLPNTFVKLFSKLLYETSMKYDLVREIYRLM